jgi:glycosyltransferase involved in cell wall biosynthesis
LRILITSDAWEPQVNGVVRTLQMTIRELERLGHRVATLTPQGFRSVACPTYPEIRLALAGSRMVARRIENFAPDRIHIATEGPLGWLARAVALRRGWPFSTAYHSRFPEYVKLRFRVPLSLSYGVLRRFHNAAVATLVPTQAMVADLNRQGFTRARLWSRGVDLDQFTPDGPCQERESDPVFLYVGRIAPEKQVESFLALDLPGCKWVVGDGPDAARLKAAYPGVRWFGTLRGPELASAYRSADVMVFPSRTDTFGLVLIEAMACGTPVAALPVNGPIDVVGSGGVLDADLGRAALAALAVPRERALAQGRCFSWAEATQQFLAGLEPEMPATAAVRRVSR